MKRILGLVLLCAATAFAANPSLYIPWTAIRGTNGITTTTNPSLGIVIFDPRAFTNDAGFSNRVVQLVNANATSGPWTNSNGTISNSVASAVSNFVFSSSALLGDIPLAVFREKGTNRLAIWPDGGLFSGDAVMENDWAIRSIRPTYGVQNGNKNEIIVSHISETNTSFFTAYLDQGYGVDFQLKHVNANTALNTFLESEVLPGSIYLRLDAGGNPRTLFQPTIADGSTPYVMDTSISHTSGNLLEVKNAGVTHLSLASTNGIATPEITAYGGTSQPWLLGSVVEGATVTLNTTNYVEVVINGVLRKLLIANP